MIERMEESFKIFWNLLFRICYHLFDNIPRYCRVSKIGMSNSFTCLNGKTAIVTGGNSGIGYMTSVLLASRGCKVIIACRRKAEKERDQIIEETNNPNIIVKHLDLTRLSSVRKFAEEIKKEETKIDILINNAGIGLSTGISTEDGVDILMMTNHFGHFLLFHLLIDLLKRGSDPKIVFMSSGLASAHQMCVKNLYDSAPKFETYLMGYANSKAYNILVAQELSKKVAKYGIKVNAADPGIVRTPIFDIFQGPGFRNFILRRIIDCINFLFATDLLTAAQTPFHVATSNKISSGENYFRCKPIPKIRGMNDQELCDQIWKESEKVVKLSSEEKL